MLCFPFAFIYCLYPFLTALSKRWSRLPTTHLMRKLHFIGFNCISVKLRSNSGADGERQRTDCWAEQKTANRTELKMKWKHNGSRPKSDRCAYAHWCSVPFAVRPLPSLSTAAHQWHNGLFCATCVPFLVVRSFARISAELRTPSY